MLSVPVRLSWFFYLTIYLQPICRWRDNQVPEHVAAIKNGTVLTPLPPLPGTVLRFASSNFASSNYAKPIPVQPICGPLDRPTFSTSGVTYGWLVRRFSVAKVMIGWPSSDLLHCPGCVVVSKYLVINHWSNDDGQRYPGWQDLYIPKQQAQ